MTVYVVTDGCYSDYSIQAIFSTIEKAEAYIALVKEKCGGEERAVSDMGVEEWSVDTLAEAVVATIYTCRMDLPTGHLWPDQARPRREIVPAGQRAVGDPNIAKMHLTGSIDDIFEGRAGEREVIVARSTVSQDHAQKLAAEFRQRTLALRAGV